jgi:hypothetical protein
MMSPWGVLMMFSFYARCCVLLIFSTSVLASPTIRYLDNAENVDPYTPYFKGLLQLAVDKSANTYGVVALHGVPVSMYDQRKFVSLDSRVIDIMWTTSTTEREQQALPIRFPLLKGLLGYRVFAIRKSDSEIFSAIQSLEQLAQLTALQGHDWPDVAILRHAGLKVETLNWTPQFYKLLSGGNVDYYPRSVMEISRELASQNDPNLIIDKNHLLIYPHVMYFFVAKGNHTLANRIEFGLREALQDGSFDKYFANYRDHPAGLQLLEQKRLIFHLENPNAPSNMPLADQALWYQPASMHR